MMRKGFLSGREFLAVTGVIALVVFIGMGLTGFSTLSITSDLCVNSIDDISISSNVLDFGGDDAFSISGVSGNCDNKIIGGGGTIPAGDIEAGGLQATKDFTVGVTSMDQYMFHEIQDFKNPVYDVRTRELTNDNVRNILDNGCSGFLGGCTEQDYIDACRVWQEETPASAVVEQPRDTQEFDDYKISGNIGDGSAVMFCSRAQKAGVNSDYGIDSFSDFQAQITAVSGSRSGSDTISKDDATANIEISDLNGDGDTEKVRVTWLGSLLTDLRSADFHNDFRPVFACTSQDCGDPNEISWQVSSESQYENYVSSIQSFDENVKQEIADGGDGSDTVQSYKNNVNLLLDSDEQALLNQLGSWADRIETRNGETRVYAADGRNVENPEFRFLIDAEWVAAEIPVAQPTITQLPNSIEVGGGSESTFQVTVRNDASVSGTVQVGATCNNQLVTVDSTLASIPSGESRTVSLTADASQSNSDVDVSCNVFAQDTDDESTRDTSSMTVTVLSSCDDPDGDGVCSQFDECPDTAGSASNNGCPVNEVCGDGIDNDGDGQVDEGCDDNDGWFSGFENPFTDLWQGITEGSTGGKSSALFYLDLFLSFVAGTAVFGFARSTLADLAGVTGRNRLLFGIVVGVAGAFVAYQFVTMLIVKILLIVGVVVYAYIKSLIPGL